MSTHPAPGYTNTVTLDDPLASPQRPSPSPEYLVLGPPAVRDGPELRRLRGRRQVLLFCLLVASAGSPVDTGRLTEALWPTARPTDHHNALQSQVSRLRRCLGGAVRYRAGGYQLDAARGSVDAHVFEQLVVDARRLVDAGSYTLAGRLADDALGLWRGEPMADMHDTEALRREAMRLHDLRVEASVVRVQADLGLGLHQAAVIPLNRLVEQYPLREDLWSLLVLALYRCERSADALAAYRRARGLLRRDLGLEPGPRLKALERGILSRSPELAAPVHPCSAHAPVFAGGAASRALSLPPPVTGSGPPPGWDHFPATRLFLDRVRAGRPGFAPSLREAAQIVTVCRLLEGEPLAIELAAACVAEGGNPGRLLARHAQSRMAESAREATLASAPSGGAAVGPAALVSAGPRLAPVRGRLE
jgi:DNA-binding SARP family transcriptional activator